MPTPCVPGRSTIARYRRYAFPGTRRWQDMREMRSRATGSGKISPRCVPGRSTMAKCSRDAFPSVRRWRDCALMRPWPDWQWQYSRAVRSRVPGGNPWQVLRAMHPESGLGRENRQFMARFARHASENGLALARYARHASEMPRKPPLEDTPCEYLARKGRFSLRGPLESRTARRSCHRSAHERKGSGRKCLRFVKN